MIETGKVDGQGSLVDVSLHRCTFVGRLCILHYM